MAHKFTVADMDRYNRFFGDNLSKSQKTQNRILEGAIESYYERGIEKTTFASVARNSNVSRPLVVHYFKTLDDVFQNTIELVSIHYLKILLETATENESAKVQLKAFVNTYLSWAKNNPKHMKVVLLSYFKCMSSDKAKQANTQILSQGLEKLIGLIKYGKKTGEFHCESPTVAGYEILTQLLGLLVLTNTTSILEGRNIESQAFKSGLKVVDYRG